MCRDLDLSPIRAELPGVAQFLNAMQECHGNGRVVFSGFKIGVNAQFDRFASRDWLLQHAILARLLHREEVRRSVPELEIAQLESGMDSQGALQELTQKFKKESPYLLLGYLAWSLDEGGAYWKPRGDGRAAAELAISFCNALFQLRFGEVECFTTSAPWTSWFCDVAWDWTAVIIDLRERIFWLLAKTDED